MDKEKKTITISEEEFDTIGFDVVKDFSTDKEGKTNPMGFMIGSLLLAKLSCTLFGKDKSQDKPQDEKVEGEA